MISFDELVVTSIRQPTVVHTKKGTRFTMENRPYFGVCFSMGGQITYNMNGKKYVSNQSNAVLLPKGGTYTLYGNAEGVFPVINFTCTDFFCDEIMVFPLEQPESCIKSVEALRYLFQHNGSPLEIYGSFYNLLSKIFSVRAKMPATLAFVVEYIEENIQDPNLSNVALAKKMGISEVYLRKLFLSHCGMTPRQYVLEERFKKAKQMLVDTPFTVASISEDCGFASVYHFCRTFKKRIGMTPTQYAEENKIYKI
jgi:AraC-like DNA-binding protein